VARPTQPSAEAEAQERTGERTGERVGERAAGAAGAGTGDHERERRHFEAAAEQIRSAVQSDASLADLSRQLSIDVTPDGLRIQILDEEQEPMFATGSAAPNDRARRLVEKVAPVLQHMSESVAIVGHTDAAPFRGGERSNWELSADRANATRRLLTEAGLPEARIRSVSGAADRDPLLPADPLAAANRRIAIFVLGTGSEAAGATAPAVAGASAMPVPGR
jgi:chemotaxis protein MotB